MPKGRYAIMLDYMPKVGSLGLDMMLRTCTIQTNLDYASEADMARKFRVGLALQPLATALVRQFALHRRQAQRLPLLPQPHLVGHRPRPHRHAALRVRGRLRLRALSRLRARCADVLRLPRRPLYRRRRPVLPRLPRRPPARPSRREAARLRLHRPSLDHLPRGAAQELPRDARRRRRPLEPDLRAARALGRPALRRKARSTPPGTRSRTGRSTSASALRDAVPKLGLAAQTPDGETPARARQARPRHRRERAQRARPAQQLGRQ